MTSTDKCRVTIELNHHEITQARSLSTPELELLNVALDAAKWFLDSDNTQECLGRLEQLFQDDNRDKDRYALDWLEALMKVESYDDFKIQSNETCIEWIKFAMLEDGFELDSIETALRLIGDNPMNINWTDYEA